jgi:hypothetical protein
VSKSSKLSKSSKGSALSAPAAWQRLGSVNPPDLIADCSILDAGAVKHLLQDEKPFPGAANVIAREISRIITPKDVMFADAPAVEPH